MSEKTLKFNNNRLNKEESDKSKQPIDLKSVNLDQIVVSDKFNHSDDGFKYFTGHQENEVVKLLCINLPQMSRYIKYFKNGGNNMSFMVKDHNVLDKYNKVWDRIKEKLNIKFHSMPVFDETYIKAKVRKFDGKIKTKFLGDEIPKENIRYTSTACVTIDSVMRMEKKNYPQVYLEECKYKVKKIQMSKFINAELKSNSESDSEAELKSDTELVAKLESGSDSE